MEKTYLKIIDKMLDCVLFFNETLTDFKRNFEDLILGVSDNKLTELWACACAMAK